jgi:hypothetical protein
VYAKVLHACFGFHLSLIYIEEDVLSESSKVERSLLQLSFRDNEGQHWLFFLGHYRAFKAVFVKLRQIDGFETIIPIIAAIITFVNCKL